MVSASENIEMTMGLECRRCGHKWLRRKIDLPVACPRCNNRLWNEERSDGGHGNRK